jgi:hypothetical protein
MVPGTGLEPAHLLRILGPEDCEREAVNISMHSTYNFVSIQTLGLAWTQMDWLGLAWTP